MDRPENVRPESLLAARLLDSALAMTSERLRGQIEFVREIDKLKTVLRRTTLMDGSRSENSAEHSWHLALMALVLSEHSAEQVDLLRVLKMLLVHDLVEIDAGDTFCYDEEAHLDKLEREQRAAERIFRLLPADLSTELRELWDEFEDKVSAEARFATALDRLQPMLHNLSTGGGSWQEHGITRRRVEERNRVIEDGAPDLWAMARAMLDEAEARGWIDP